MLITNLSPNKIPLLLIAATTFDFGSKAKPLIQVEFRNIKESGYQVRQQSKILWETSKVLILFPTQKLIIYGNLESIVLEYQSESSQLLLQDNLWQSRANLISQCFYSESKKPKNPQASNYPFKIGVSNYSFLTSYSFTFPMINYFSEFASAFASVPPRRRALIPHKVKYFSRKAFQFNLKEVYSGVLNIFFISNHILEGEIIDLEEYGTQAHPLQQDVSVLIFELRSTKITLLWLSL